MLLCLWCAATVRVPYVPTMKQTSLLLSFSLPHRSLVRGLGAPVVAVGLVPPRADVFDPAVKASGPFRCNLTKDNTGSRDTLWCHLS